MSESDLGRCDINKQQSNPGSGIQENDLKDQMSSVETEAWPGIQYGASSQKS